MDGETDREANLGTPVTEIVHTSNLPSTCTIQVCQKSPDNSTPQMPHMKALRNIRRRILDYHLLPLP